MDFSATPATSAPPGFGENIDFSSPFYTPAATTDSVSGPSETLHTSNAVIGSGAPSSTPATPSTPEDVPAPSTSASASTSTSFAAPQAYDAYSEMFPSLPTAKPGTFKPAPPPVSYAPLKIRDHVDRFQIDPAQLRPSGIGEKAHSEICKSIMHETGSKIEFSSAKNGIMTVIVSGKPENVANAKKKILAALSKQYELKVEVPREHLSALIGKQGTKLKSLQDKTGARIQVPKAEEEKDFVVISGSKASVEQARIEVLEFLKEKSNFIRESVTIEPNFQPFVYGPGNETLKEIALETGAKIHVPPSDSTETDIIVAGPREAVAEALKKIQNIYTEKKRTTKSASIIVNKKQHRFIIGVKGVNIQEILKTTGCLVSVPPLESTSDTITVSGDESKILPALQLVMEKANSVCVEEIKIEGAHLQRYIKAKGRQLLKELEKDTKVQISYTNPILDIQGPKEEVEKVRNAVINQLAEFKKLKFDEVEVAQDLRKFLIGKNGGNIKKIKADYNVDVFVPHEDEESEYRTVLLAGEKDKIKLVKDQILKNAKEWANLTVIEVKVDPKFHKTIIGKKGETIKKLNEDFETCSIKVPASEDESNIITLRGPKDEVEKLHKLIVKLVEETRHYEVMHNYTEEIYIDKKAIKYIVGKGGVAINKLREIHDVKIEIDNPKEEAKEGEKEKEKEKEAEKAEKPKEGEKGKGKGKDKDKDAKDAKDAKEEKPKPKTGKENSEKVTIQGVKKNVEEAKAALLAKAKEILEGGGMVTVELHIDPKFHGNLIGSQGKFVRSLSERHSVNVRFPRGDAPSDIVTISGFKTSVDKAQAELLELLEYEKSLSFTQTITAQNSVLRHIFGLNDGSKLKLIQIMEQTKTQVDFQNNDKEGNVIVIKGTEKAVAESKKLVEKLVEEVSNTVTEEIEVDTQYHGIIIGVRGARVRELSEKHVVDIKFPLDKTSKVIRVKGFRANVNAAKAAILEVVKGIENEKASQVTKSFDIPKKYYPGLKEFIRNHTNELPVRITLPKDNEDSEAVILKGKEEDIEKSIALLKDNLEETLVVQIPRELHRNIVSEGKIKKLNQDLKVVVRFPDRDSKSSDVSIRGKGDAIAEAAKILSQYAEVAAQPRTSETQAPVRENPDRQQESIKVNPEYFGKIIGKGGKTIRNLSDVSGVKIDLKKEAGEISLSGSREGIEFAKRELNELISDLESRATEVLEVPQAFHPRLAGVKFSNLYKIQDDFEVSIRLDRESDKVSVTGNKEDVKAAVAYIRELIKEIKFDLDQASSAREKRESSNGKEKEKEKEKDKSRAPAYDASFFAPPPQSTTTVDKSSVWGSRLN